MHRDGVPCNFASTDHKHFFNVKSSKLNVEFVDAANAEEIAIEDDVIAQYHFKMSHWRDVIAKDVNSYDIVIDDTYDEIDPEVKSLCDALNTHLAGLRTVNSCSGHNVRFAYVMCEVEDIDALQKLFVIAGLKKFKNSIQVKPNDIFAEYDLTYV